MLFHCLRIQPIFRCRCHFLLLLASVLLYVTENVIRTVASAATIDIRIALIGAMTTNIDPI
jgi:hypothetical protein